MSFPDWEPLASWDVISLTFMCEVYIPNNVGLTSMRADLWPFLLVCAVTALIQLKFENKLPQ